MCQGNQPGRVTTYVPMYTCILLHVDFRLLIRLTSSYQQLTYCHTYIRIWVSETSRYVLVFSNKREERDYKVSVATEESIYRRLGFDCKILMIANCEFFRSLQSKGSQSTTQAYSITRYGVDGHNR